MGTFSYKATEEKKDKFYKDLSVLLQIIENCPDDMLFQADIEVNGIDPRFAEVASTIINNRNNHQKMDSPFSNINIDEIKENLKKTFHDSQEKT